MRAFFFCSCAEGFDALAELSSQSARHDANACALVCEQSSLEQRVRSVAHLTVSIAAATSQPAAMSQLWSSAAVALDAQVERDGRVDELPAADAVRPDAAPPTTSPTTAANVVRDALLAPILSTVAARLAMSSVRATAPDDQQHDRLQSLEGRIRGVVLQLHHQSFASWFVAMAGDLPSQGEQLAPSILFFPRLAGGTHDLLDPITEEMEVLLTQATDDIHVVAHPEYADVQAPAVPPVVSANNTSHAVPTLAAERQQLLTGLSAAMRRTWQRWSDMVVAAVVSWIDVPRAAGQHEVAPFKTAASAAMTAAATASVPTAEGTPASLHTTLKKLAAELKDTIKIRRLVNRLDRDSSASPLLPTSASAAATPLPHLHQADLSLADAAAIFRSHQPSHLLRTTLRGSDKLDDAGAADSHRPHHPATVLSLAAFVGSNRLADLVAAAIQQSTSMPGGDSGIDLAAYVSACEKSRSDASFVLAAVADCLHLHLLASVTEPPGEHTVFYADGSSVMVSRRVSSVCKHVIDDLHDLFASDDALGQRRACSPRRTQRAVDRHAATHAYCRRRGAACTWRTPSDLTHTLVGNPFLALLQHVPAPLALQLSCWRSTGHSAALTISALCEWRRSAFVADRRLCACLSGCPACGSGRGAARVVNAATGQPRRQCWPNLDPRGRPSHIRRPSTT